MNSRTGTWNCEVEVELRNSNSIWFLFLMLSTICTIVILRDLLFRFSMFPCPGKSRYVLPIIQKQNRMRTLIIIDKYKHKRFVSFSILYPVSLAIPIFPYVISTLWFLSIPVRKRICLNGITMYMMMNEDVKWINMGSWLSNKVYIDL